MKAPTFILADEAGQTQLALVTGDLGDAQRKAELLAMDGHRTVLVYSVTHVATYHPGTPAVSAPSP